MRARSELAAGTMQHHTHQPSMRNMKAALYIHTPLCVHRFPFVLLMLLFPVFDYDGSCCYANGALQSFSL